MQCRRGYPLIPPPQRLESQIWCGLGGGVWLTQYLDTVERDSLMPSDSGGADGQMQQSRGAAAENGAALAAAAAPARAHSDGVAARKRDDAA